MGAILQDLGEVRVKLRPSCGPAQDWAARYSRCCAQTVSRKAKIAPSASSTPLHSAIWAASPVRLMLAKARSTPVAYTVTQRAVKRRTCRYQAAANAACSSACRTSVAMRSSDRSSRGVMVRSFLAVYGILLKVLDSPRSARLSRGRTCGILASAPTRVPIGFASTESTRPE